MGVVLAGFFIGILAYADDIVLMAPSWCGLQKLLDILEKACKDTGKPFNTKKTVCKISTLATSIKLFGFSSFSWLTIITLILYASLRI